MATQRLAQIQATLSWRKHLHLQETITMTQRRVLPIEDFPEPAQYLVVWPFWVSTERKRLGSELYRRLVKTRAIFPQAVRIGPWIGGGKGRGPVSTQHKIIYLAANPKVVQFRLCWVRRMRMRNNSGRCKVADSPYNTSAHKEQDNGNFKPRVVSWEGNTRSKSSCRLIENEIRCNELL